MLEICVLPTIKGTPQTIGAGTAASQLHAVGDVEVVYSQSDSSELMDIIFFIMDWKSDKGRKKPRLPKVFFGESSTPPARYQDALEEFIQSDEPLVKAKVRFPYLTSTRELLTDYLAHLELKVVEKRSDAEEGFTVDLAHPLFYPVTNSELNREQVQMETLRDFFKALIRTHFPERGQMN